MGKELPESAVQFVHQQETIPVRQKPGDGWVMKDYNQKT
jgi:hypothetical protein